jgi:hypothetical protein
MKRKTSIALVLALILILIFSCKKENTDLLIGKWKLVKTFSFMGGNYFPEIQEQRIEEYTKKKRILFDFEGNEIVRSDYKATNSIINVFGKEINGDQWDFNIDYWLVNDTLKLRHSGGFEYYDEFLIRIK